MKIANLVCVFPPYKGGIGNSAKKIAEILGSEHAVTTFTPIYGEKMESENVIRLKPFLKFGNGAFLPQLFFKLRGFDCLYLHYPFFGAAEIVWLFKIFNKKTKLIIHYHMDTPGLSLLAKILSLPSRLIRPWLFNRADKIVCASLDYTGQSDIKRYYQKNLQKFLEIPFSVDVKRFSPKKGEKPKGFTILFVGGLDKAHAFKGVNVLLKAFSLSRAGKKNDSLLWIVGQGELKNEYQKKAEALKIEDKVKFLDNISNQELPSVYRQADIFVLPSTGKNEAFGIVLLEAMASGLPVIASDLPGVRKTFNNLEQGLLAKPGDANDLKEKIDELYGDEEKRLKMSKASLRLAEEKYSQTKISDKIINLLKEI